MRPFFFVRCPGKIEKAESKQHWHMLARGGTQTEPEEEREREREQTFGNAKLVILKLVAVGH